MSLYPNADLLRQLRDGSPWNPEVFAAFITEAQKQDQRIALFAQSFQAVFMQGKIKRDLLGFGGLRGDEVHTAQSGSVLFVENATNETRTGGIIPYLPDVTLPAGTIFPFVHDAPIGATDKYLNAYAGLVKSEAFVLAAQIRPNPFEGIRIFVYGELGDTKEVVIFNGQDKGRATQVRFAEVPTVYECGVSQIVSLTFAMALENDLDLQDAERTVRFGNSGNQDVRLALNGHLEL